MWFAVIDVTDLRTELYSTTSYANNFLSQMRPHMPTTSLADETFFFYQDETFFI